MDREPGTERLADASFLEELLRGRRTLVVATGDDASAQHLLKRLGRGLEVVEARGGAIPKPDRSADAVIALGAFQEPEGIDRLIAEARRVLAPGGLFASSWVDPSRQTLEAQPSREAPHPALSAAEAQRRLAGRFGWVAIVARQPYLGFQFVSGIDTQGAVALDTSLTGGGAEAPSGYLAIAADQALPLTDLLVQVPYDRIVERVRQWMRSTERPSEPPAMTSRGGAVARPRDGGTEVERLRGEIASLRDRAQGAVEEADRARGDSRAARERVALLEAEVSKLRGRLKGAPDPDAERLRGELEARTKERDGARRDAEGAAMEAARALEAAAQYEREVDHLTDKVQALERELASEAAAKEKALADLKMSVSERQRLAQELEGARDERDRLAQELDTTSKELVTTAEKRAADANRRNEQTLKRLQDAEKRVSELEAAKSAAERTAEEAWKRVQQAQKEAQAQPAPAVLASDVVPEADLQAAQRALASAIQRAEDAERERRKLVEEGQKANPEEVRALRSALAETQAELDAARAKSSDADLEGMKSLLHQRDTSLAEARERAGSAEQRAARFATETAEALAKLKEIEETLSVRDGELKRALAALDGVETREARDKELIDELKGEVARLTEALASAREDVARAEKRAEEAGHAGQPVPKSVDLKELEAAVAEAARAQAEAARVHAELDALKEQTEKSRQELEELRESSGKSESRDTERERRIAELEAKLLETESKRESTGDIERRSVAMAQKMAMLEAELERARDEVKQATAEARKFRALAEAIEPPADRGKA